ncbi:GGDEF domain-containing protein [Halioglobus pacificus]|uniref:GGDEF domain-containing protein n=1 Tax=Parahalioglobus pacificus TaxID=930806 RepID=UPI00167AAB21|nr:GGDEF domain-containing protein [Halioglobus pacificus]
MTNLSFFESKQRCQSLVHINRGWAIAVLSLVSVLVCNPVVASLTTQQVDEIGDLETRNALDAFESTLGDKFSEPRELGKALLLLGKAWEGINDFDTALTRANSAVELLEPLGTSALLIEALQDRSYYLYVTTGERSSYCPDRERTVELSRELENQRLLVGQLIRRSFCFDGDDLALGLRDLEEALQITVDFELGDEALAMVANARGNLFRSVEIHDRAYSAYADALKIWSAKDDTTDEFNMLHALAGEAIQMGAWELAEVHIKSMFTIDEEFGSDTTDFKFFAWFNESRMQLARRNYGEAASAIDNALNLSHTTTERKFVRDALLISAEVHLMSGDIERAQKYLSDYLGLADHESDPIYRILEDLSSSLEKVDVSGVLTAMVTLRATEAEQVYAANNARRRLLAAAHENESERLRAEILQRELALSERGLEVADAQAKLSRQATTIASLGFLLAVAASAWLAKSLRLNRKAAHTDYLTGIANRGRIFKLGFTLRDKMKRKGRAFSVVMFDLDHFKGINDTQGHAMGDEVIRKTVEAAQSVLHGGQVLGRLGGEEFIALLPGADKEEAILVAENIRAAVESADCTYGQKNLTDFTVSIGVATLEAEDNFQQLVNRADSALYSAKSAGRNRVRFADSIPTYSTGNHVTRRTPR